MEHLQSRRLVFELLHFLVPHERRLHGELIIELGHLCIRLDSGNTRVYFLRAARPINLKRLIEVFFVHDEQQSDVQLDGILL